MERCGPILWRCLSGSYEVARFWNVTGVVRNHSIVWVLLPYDFYHASSSMFLFCGSYF